MSDLIHDAYDSTRRGDDERLLIRAVASFSLRAEMRELLLSLPSDAFHSPVRGAIWEAGRDLAKESRIITLDNMRKKLKPGEFEILEREYGQGVRLVEVTRGIELVRNAAKTRQLVNSLAGILAQIPASEDYSSLLGKAHLELDALDAAETSGEAIPIAQAIEEFWEEFYNPSPDNERIPSPWHGLNDIMGGGATRGSLTVFGAPPGDGKTVAMMNWAGFAAMTDYKVAIFSLEMNSQDLVSRLIAAEARERISDITRRSLTQTSIDVLTGFTDKMSKTTLRIYDAAGADADYIRQQAAVMKREVGLDIIVVDYLQIMEATGGDNREQQVGKIAQQLKTLAMKLDVVVLTASQLNDTEVGMAPTLRSLRESRAIGQHADNVIMNVHDRDENGQKTGDMAFHVVKNRRDRTGVVPQDWRGDQVRIGEPRHLRAV